MVAQTVKTCGRGDGDIITVATTQKTFEMPRTIWPNYETIQLKAYPSNAVKRNNKNKKKAPDDFVKSTRGILPACIV
jgi:hypothetical protein